MAASLPDKTVLVIRDSLQIIETIIIRLTELPTNSDRQLREVVGSGLLRRAFVTATSAAYLAMRGQVEGCMVLSRTILEVWMTAKLVFSDKTNGLAKRLVAVDYRNRHKYGEKMLSDSPTRAKLQQHEGERQRTAAVARSWKDQFEGHFFDEVRADLERDLKDGKGWHGFKNIGDAFAAIGESPEYFRQYGLTSPFVHGGNIEWDFVEAREGKPFLRQLHEPSADTMSPHAAMALFRLWEIAFALIEDRLSAPELVDAASQVRRTELLNATLDELHRVFPMLMSVLAIDPIAGTHHGTAGEPPVREVRNLAHSPRSRSTSDR